MSKQLTMKIFTFHLTSNRFSVLVQWEVQPKHVQYRQEMNVNHALFIEIHMKKKFSSSENALKIKAHFSLAPPVSI